MCHGPECSNSEHPEPQAIQICDKPECEAPKNPEPHVVEAVCPEPGYPGAKHPEPQGYEPESPVHAEVVEPHRPGYQHTSTEEEPTKVVSESSEKPSSGDGYNVPKEQGGYHAAEEGTELQAESETKVHVPAESTFTVHPARPTHAPAGGNTTVAKSHEPTQVALGSHLVESVSGVVVALGVVLLV